MPTTKPVALITGASRGIGTAIAETLAPTHRLLLAGRPSERLAEVCDRLGASSWPLELTDFEAIATNGRKIDTLDVLVHNAGVAYPATVAESTPEQWRRTFDINVTGPVALTLAVLPALRAAQGQVVFINSGAGINAQPALASYSASKFALRAFADTLRSSEPALRVTSVHPGRVDTEMQEGLIAYEGGQYEPTKFLRAATVARAVAAVIATPADGHTHEVVIRPRGHHH
jgi:NADP-dependent 3-hydroxy acid dehydrogenase YdfG